MKTKYLWWWSSCHPPAPLRSWGTSQCGWARSLHWSRWRSPREGMQAGTAAAWTAPMTCKLSLESAHFQPLQIQQQDLSTPQNTTFWVSFGHPKRLHTELKTRLPNILHIIFKGPVVSQGKDREGHMRTGVGSEWRNTDHHRPNKQSQSEESLVGGHDAHDFGFFTTNISHTLPGKEFLLKIVQSPLLVYSPRQALELGWQK